MKTINDYFLEFKNSFKGSHTNYIINNLMEKYGLAPLSEKETEIVKEKFPLWMGKPIPLETNSGECLKIIILLENQEISEDNKANINIKLRFFLIYLNEKINLKSTPELSKYVTNLSVNENSEIFFKIHWKENEEEEEEISKDVRIAKENLLNKWVKLKTPTFSMLLSFEEKMGPSPSKVSHTPKGSNKNNSESKEKSLTHENQASTACKTSENELLQEKGVIIDLQNQIYNLKKENENFKKDQAEIFNTNSKDKILLMKKQQKIHSLLNETIEKAEEIKSLKKKNEEEIKSIKKINEEEIKSIKKINEEEIKSIKKINEEEILRLSNSKEQEIKRLLNFKEEEMKVEMENLRISYDKVIKDKGIEKEKEKDEIRQSLEKQISLLKNDLGKLNQTLNDKGKSILEKYNDLERDADDFINININLEREIKEKDEEIERLKDDLKFLKLKTVEADVAIKLLQNEVKSLLPKEKLSNKSTETFKSKIRSINPNPKSNTQILPPISKKK